MPQATFDLVLSREKVLLFYKAKKNRIQVTARDGRTINLPWELLRPHIQPSGINGTFTIFFRRQRQMRTVGPGAELASHKEQARSRTASLPLQ